MKTIQRRYCVSEAAFMLRVLLGPNFGNLYTTLADQRRGRKTKLPFIPYDTENAMPYYLSTDLESFIEEVRATPRIGTKAKNGIKPVFRDVDLWEEMSL